MSIIEIEAGVKNLLQRCANTQSGEKLVIVGESGPAPYYDPELCYEVKNIADSLGVKAEIVWADPVDSVDDFPKKVEKAVRSTNTTIFLSRLGDQIRFVNLPDMGKKVMCYTYTREHFASKFSTIDHVKMQDIHHLLKDAILSSKEYSIRASCGTNLHGEIYQSLSSDKEATAEFEVDLFPEVIFAPIRCHRMSGNLVIQNFVTSSSTRMYDDSVLLFDQEVNALIVDSQITKLEGEHSQVEALEKQLKRAASITGGDPFSLNSWHTGINPGAFFNGDPYEDLERWGCIAFGSPRYTHFHGAGKDPGDVAYHLFDATISFDNQIFWQDGHFLFLDRPEIQSLLTREESKFLNSEFYLDIGI